MALLNAVLPKSPSLPRFTYPNQKGSKHVLGGQVRAPSLSKKASHLTVKCFKGIIPSPPHLDKLINGAIIPKPDQVTRKDFPKDFKFGASTSAIQTEGPGDEGGRGPSTWDFMIQDADGVKDYAVDSYNRYKEDVKLLKDMGANAYRFSIAWPRILPHGSVSGGINQEGIDFYNNFIDELCRNGIEPFVTLFHFDLPTALQNEYYGFLDRRIVDDFKAYADICFKNFGDRVKYWTTINEPQVYGQFGYKVGNPKPNQNAATDAFLASHHIILAHGAAAKLYKEKYQPTQGGEIGITSASQWFEPHSDSVHDREAAARAMDFSTDWFIEPLVHGDYPFAMKALIGNGLPSFTDEDKEMIQGSFDFIGVNYYTARYAKSIPMKPNESYTTYDQYQHVEVKVDKDGKPIGGSTPGSKEIFTYPKGLTHVLLHLKEDYNNPKIYITENGYPEKRDDTVPLEKALEDNDRIESMLAHLSAIREAMKQGVNVKGYFQWALMDCMEVGAWYTVRFGLNYVDFNDGLKRYPKKSAKWLQSFLKD